MMKAVANAIYTATATAGANTRIDAANTRIDASNTQITKVETRSSDTCSQVIKFSFH